MGNIFNSIMWSQLFWTRIFKPHNPCYFSTIPKHATVKKNQQIYFCDRQCLLWKKKPNGKWELSVGDISRFYKSYRLTVWVSAAKDVANFWTDMVLIFIEACSYMSQDGLWRTYERVPPTFQDKLKRSILFTFPCSMQ